MKSRSGSETAAAEAAVVSNSNPARCELWKGFLNDRSERIWTHVSGDYFRNRRVLISARFHPILRSWPRRAKRNTGHAAVARIRSRAADMGLGPRAYISTEPPKWTQNLRGPSDHFTT